MPWLVIMPAMVRKHLSRFEDLARRAIEGSMVRLVGRDELMLQIAARLGQALDQYQTLPDLPHTFRILVNPADYDDIASRIPELEKWLKSNLGSFSDGVPVPTRTSVSVASDETMPRGEVSVELFPDSDDGHTTNVYRRGREIDVESIRILDAFLIVNGRRHVALDRPFVTIGRRIDNDVIIDSPVVSRQHAHIRWKHGRFVLYDVGSRGGVQVNGKGVNECVLQPGDLVTLSGRVPLIYGEGLEDRNNVRSTPDDGQETRAYASEKS